MRRSHLWFAAIVLSCCVTFAGTPNTAQAQSDEEIFTTMMQKASDLYKSEDYAASLFAYLEVKSRFSSPVVDYSLGRSYQQLYRCKEAMAFYMFVMNDYDLSEDDKLFEKAANYYNELTPCEDWGTVELTCESPNSRLSIEDKPMGRCLSGLYRMREGKYTFKIEGEGVDPVETDVRISNGKEEKISLKLPPVIQEVEKVVEVEAPGGAQKSDPNWLAWGLIGGGTALLIAGGFTNAAGFDDLREAQRAADARDDAALQEAKDSASTNKILTGVFMGLGVAAVGTGLTFAILDLLDDGEAAPEEAGDLDVGATVSGDGGSIFLKTTF